MDFNNDQKEAPRTDRVPVHDDRIAIDLDARRVSFLGAPTGQGSNALTSTPNARTLAIARPPAWLMLRRQAVTSEAAAALAAPPVSRTCGAPPCAR